VYQSFLLWLAERLGVDPAGSGEALEPAIRFEQPFSQLTLIALVVAAAVLVFAVYRRETTAPRPWRLGLAVLRLSLVLLILFLLSEASLTVERTGLPTIVVMVDDSASQGLSDRPADPDLARAIRDLGAYAPGIATNPTASQSQSDSRASLEIPRIALTQAILSRDNGAFLRALQAKHKVRIETVSTATRTLAVIEDEDGIAPALEAIAKLEASGSSSKLGAGVRQVLTQLRGVAPTAIIMFTDGQTTEGEDLASAAELAKRKGVPIITVGLGDPDAPRDLELLELQVDEVAFKEDPIPFKAKLLSMGYEGRPVTIRLLEQPDETNPKADRLLKELTVQAPADGTPLPLEIVHLPEQTGDIRYVLEVEPQEREIQLENNRIVRVVSVRDQKLRALLVDGQPRYEYRYLKTFLERERATIDLHVLLLSSDPEYAEQDRVALATFPTSRDDLFNYDVIILGDVDPSFLSAGQQEALVEFVTRKGGGVMFVAGEYFNPLSYKNTALEDLLPIDLAEARDPSVAATVPPFRPELTVEGRASPIFRFGDDAISSLTIWENLPPVNWYFEVARTKPAAVTLAVHPKPLGGMDRAPLICYQFVGAGKTLFSGIDETWKWRFRVGDRYFGRYWTQSLRFLARTKLLGQRQAEIVTDRLRYQRNQPIQVRVRFPNPALALGIKSVNVQVERKGEGSRTLTLEAVPGNPSVFEGALPQGREGEYVVKLLPPPVLEGDLPSCTFRIEPPAGELERSQMNASELRRVAELTGGRFHTLTSLDGLLEHLPPPQKVPLDTDPPIPLWNTWPVLTLFLTLITLEWVLRKRKQLV